MRSRLVLAAHPPCRFPLESSTARSGQHVAGGQGDYRPECGRGSGAISRLGAGSKYVRAIVESGRPKVVTEGGVGVAVILDVEMFEALLTEQAAGEVERDLRTAWPRLTPGRSSSMKQ